MKQLLYLAHDTSIVPEIRKRKSHHMVMNNYIEAIDSFDSITLNPNIDMDIVNIANLISNLEPSIYLSDGSVMTLADIRMRGEYSPDEVKFIMDSVSRVVRPYIDATIPNIKKAIKHLLFGSEVINDFEAYKRILRSSLIHIEPESCILTLCAYAVKLGCKSVTELSNLFAFYYPDRYNYVAGRNSEVMVRYTFRGKSFTQMAR